MLSRSLRDGANVVLGALTEKKLTAVAQELDPSGERVAAAPLDITDAESCGAFVELAVQRFGGIDADAARRHLAR